jgi:hypothetical protein
VTMTQYSTENGPPREVASTDRSAFLWMYCREIAPYETPAFIKNVGELIARATNADPRPAAPIFKMNMLRPRSRRPTVPKFAYDRALHYLARRREYKLSDGIRHCLTQVVEGYTGRCDEAAARQGIDWMREKSRAVQASDKTGS